MAEIAQEFSNKGMTDNEAILATNLVAAFMSSLTENKEASNHF
jgi:hypothetical protein